jgi:hypothetical protein
VLEPLAERLGVSYIGSSVTAPVHEKQRVLDALRCGLRLIVDFTSAGEWQLVHRDDVIAHDQRQIAARLFRGALESPAGQEAISAATQGYGRVAAAASRRDAVNGIFAGDDSARLVAADASTKLVDLVGRAIPIRDPHKVLPKVGAAAHTHFYAPNNGAREMPGHRESAAKARVICDALALTLGAAYQKFVPILIDPILELNLPYASCAMANWTVIGLHWSNLLIRDPVAYTDITSAIRRATESPS